MTVPRHAIRGARCQCVDDDETLEGCRHHIAPDYWPHLDHYFGSESYEPLPFKRGAVFTLERVAAEPMCALGYCLIFQEIDGRWPPGGFCLLTAPSAERELETTC